jgi:lipopolysaccharide/colanic/teichoic acid biosynthesis glycosyltransferase
MDSKRTVDLVVGSATLVLAVPVFAAIKVAMVLTGDRGPFLYRATRVGQGGREIRVLKIRTMHAGSTGSAITASGDPRITRVGRVVRRYRLDELPQLVNVVCGEMSLVGPRPEDPRFVDWADPVHQRVFRAKPGITGLAQLDFHDEAKYLTSPDVEGVYRRDVLPAKVRLDLEYLEHQSLGLDLRIIARTARTVLSRSR